MNNNRGIDEFIKEKWCIEQAQIRGVPGPKVLNLGELDNFSYMVESFLEGVVGTQNSLDAMSIWHEIGKYAKLIHSIPVSGMGLDSIDILPAKNSTSHEK